MGHDITAYPKDTATSDEAEEIAYLQRGAFNPLNGQIYEFLNCPEKNCGVSGCGGKKIFTQEDLKKGMDKLLTYPEDDTKPEKEFLQKCLDCGEDILIHFC